jgi:hypothetical protein
MVTHETSTLDVLEEQASCTSTSNQGVFGHSNDACNVDIVSLKPARFTKGNRTVRKQDKDQAHEKAHPDI